MHPSPPCLESPALDASSARDPAGAGGICELPPPATRASRAAADRDTPKARAILHDAAAALRRSSDVNVGRASDPRLLRKTWMQLVSRTRPLNRTPVDGQELHQGL